MTALLVGSAICGFICGLTLRPYPTTASGEVGGRERGMTIKWKTEDAKQQAREHWDSPPEYVEGVATEDDKKIDEHPLKGVARYE